MSRCLCSPVPGGFGFDADGLPAWTGREKEGAWAGLQPDDVDRRGRLRGRGLEVHGTKGTMTPRVEAWRHIPMYAAVLTLSSG